MTLNLQPYTLQTFGPAFGAVSTALPGATVTVYLYGTSTKANLYNSLGSPISNPLLSDANGLATFWADSAGQYQANWVLGAYNSPTIYFPTNPGSFSSTGISTILDDVFGNTPSDILVRGPSVWEASPSSPVNPVWWGADPTGALPSDSALVAALAVSNWIRFPPGLFKFTTMITYSVLANSSVRIEGAGIDVTTLSWASWSLHGQ